MLGRSDIIEEHKDSIPFFPTGLHCFRGIRMIGSKVEGDGCLLYGFILRKQIILSAGYKNGYGCHQDNQILFHTRVLLLPFFFIIESKSIYNKFSYFSSSY